MKGDVVPPSMIKLYFHFNPLSEWRETKSFKMFQKSFEFQSALSEWRETDLPLETMVVDGISIRSLRVERDYILNYAFAILEYFNPLSPSGERLMSTING